MGGNSSLRVTPPTVLQASFIAKTSHILICIFPFWGLTGLEGLGFTSQESCGGIWE
jgi:hypothetical protein